MSILTDFDPLSMNRCILGVFDHCENCPVLLFVACFIKGADNQKVIIVLQLRTFFYVGRTKNRTKSECALSLLVMGLCSFTFLRFSSIGVECTVDWFEDGVIFSFWGADSQVRKQLCNNLKAEQGCNMVVTWSVNFLWWSGTIFSCDSVFSYKW